MQDIAAVILAGGLARRMGGGDKALLPLGGRPMLAHVLARVAPQVAGVVLNANGDPARFAPFGLPVVADSIPDFAGPLAGILAGLDWARANTGCAWVLSLAGDSPFVPGDLAGRLAAAVAGEGGETGCAMSGGQTHPVIGLWPVRLADELRSALGAGERKIDRWTGRYRVAYAAWDTAPVDPFFNVNTPEDLAAAEAILKSEQPG